MSTALATQANGPPGTGIASQSQGIHAVRETMETLKAIRTFINEEMRDGLDFGIIPGTGDRKVLLLPGAQKTAMYFNCWPKFLVERVEMGNGHLEVLVTCQLINRASTACVAEGLGSCSSMESKYRYRNAERTCPKCGSATVFKSKDEGKGFYCWKKKGGCGATFPEGHAEIVGQKAGKVENDNIHDQRNTILKMGMKRAMVSAAISLGCMSELFTQDLDDVYDLAPAEPDRDDRRREVNETFPRRAPERPQGRSAAKPVPGDEDQGPMPATRPMEQSWASFVAKACNERRDYWGAELAMAKVPQADRVRAENLLPDQHQVTNHFVTRAIETGAWKPEAVSKDGTAEGRRDPAKAKAAMAELYRRAPKRVAAAVAGYFAERERELRVRLGMDDLPDDTEGQDGAEDASQEAAGATAGREPGCEDER